MFTESQLEYLRLSVLGGCPSLRLIRSDLIESYERCYRDNAGQYSYRHRNVTVAPEVAYASYACLTSRKLESTTSQKKE